MKAGGQKLLNLNYFSIQLPLPPAAFALQRGMLLPPTPGSWRGRGSKPYVRLAWWFLNIMTALPPLKKCLLKCSELSLIAFHLSIFLGTIQLWFFHFSNIRPLIRWPARGMNLFLIINDYYFYCRAKYLSCLLSENMPWWCFIFSNVLHY